jgi:hypothetical protein
MVVIAGRLRAQAAPAGWRPMQTDWQAYLLRSSGCCAVWYEVRAQTKHACGCGAALLRQERTDVHWAHGAEAMVLV